MLVGISVSTSRLFYPHPFAVVTSTFAISLMAAAALGV